MQTLLLEPANKCIYCNRTNCALTDEHIIPYSLNGFFLLPKASCKTCQDRINKSIESPLLSGTLKPFRAKHGYRSRGKGRGPLLSEQTWSVRIQRNIAPFQQDVLEKVHDVPIPEIVYHLRLPPFLALKDKAFSFGKVGNMVRFHDLKGGGIASQLHNKLVKKYGTKGATLRISYTSPSFTIGHFEALVVKIACGFLFSSFRSLYENSDLGNALASERPFEHRIAEEIYSAPRRILLLRRNETARVFSVCEDGNIYLYCVFSILGEVFDHIYYVRIPGSRQLSGMTAIFSRDGLRYEYVKAS